MSPYLFAAVRMMSANTYSSFSYYHLIFLDGAESLLKEKKSSHVLRNYQITELKYKCLLYGENMLSNKRGNFG